MKTIQRGLAVLALLCFALPCAEAVTIINFHGTISTIEVDIGPQGQVLPRPPIAVGDVFTGSFTHDDLTNSLSLSFVSGTWSKRLSGLGTALSLQDGEVDKLSAHADTAARLFLFLTLFDPSGRAYTAGQPFAAFNPDLWTSGLIRSVERMEASPWPSARVVVEGTIMRVPDGGSTAVMFSLSLVGLVVHRRREIPSPRALRGV
jgi:hypothetical protein